MMSDSRGFTSTWLVVLIMMVAACSTDGPGDVDEASSEPLTTATATSTSSDAPTGGDADGSDGQANDGSDSDSDGCPELTNSESLEPNLDADADLERIEVGVDASGAWVIVHCDESTATLFASGSVNKPLVVYPVDIEGDGVDELLVGTSFGAGPFVGDVVRLVEGELVASGYNVSVQHGGQGAPGRTFGCVDSDGDGARELIGIDYEVDGASVTWSRFRYDGQPIELSQGVFDSATDGAAIDALRNGTCGDEVIIRVSG